ncbi:hypothetical protein BGZ76_010921 [Entomortierella beljakovae]|nr:hypothetical protein BGZ76_010921 [Entomortierella beljakovae]
MAHSESLTSPSTSTVVQIPDTQITKVSERKLDKIQAFREKLAPLLLYIVSTAQFLDVVNGASVSVAILPIAKDVDFNVSQMPWILNAYTITFAGLLLFSGRLGDLFGHRRIFLFGLFWFATWSLIVSFAKSPIFFVIARALQGIGAASTVPSAMALIAITFPVGPERAKAFSIFAAFGGLGAVVGILMAGGLISSIGWPWIFRISSVAAFILLLLGFLVIPITPPKSDKPKIDYLGAITATLGVTGIVYYISTGVEDGWASPKTLPIFIVGLLFIGSFIFVEAKVDSPLMPLRVWKNRVFVASVAIAFVQMAMFQGVIYYANMVFQEVYGWDAIHTAIGFLVHSLLAVVVFTIMGRILPRLSLKPIILTGFILRCATGLMFSFVTKDTPYWHLIFPAFILHIFGVAFSMLPIQITAIRDAENKDQGLVGAIYNTGLQLGAPFGIAILNVISISTTDNELVATLGKAELMTGYRNAFYGIIALGAIGFLMALFFLPWDKPMRPSKKIVEETKDLEVGNIDVISKIEEQEHGASVVESDASTITSSTEVKA